MTSRNVEKIERLWGDIPTREGLEAARRYALGMHKRPFAFYVRRVVDMQTEGERALDAGSGTGTWSFALAQRFAHIEAIDKAPDRVELARMMQEKLGIPNINFVEGDVLATEYPDTNFDLVFCYSVLVSYLPLRTVLAEFRRMLKPDGLLYVSLNGDGWLLYLSEVRGAESERHRRMGVEGLYRSFTERAIAQSKGELHQVLNRVSRNVGEPLGQWSGSPEDWSRIIGAVRSGATVEDIVTQLVDEGTTLLPEAALRVLTIDLVLGLFEVAVREHPIRVRAAELITSIRTDCGPRFLETLANDLLTLLRDPVASLSHATAGRGYEPSEVEQACADVGLGEFRWAEESKLFSRDLVAYEGRYGGRLKVWDFVARRVS